MKLRILVADDHEIVRQGLCRLLAAHEEWEICGEAADGMEAVKKTTDLKPDVVVLDVGMPNLNGVAATRQITKENPQQRVIILTVTDAEEVERGALNAGAREFVLKSDAARDLVIAIEAVQAGRNYFTPRMGEMLLNRYLHGSRKQTPQLPTLTPREREIVQLLAEGRSTKEAAFILNLSTKTAETHRSNVMRKLDIHSLSELVLYAVRNNIVQVHISPNHVP